MVALGMYDYGSRKHDMHLTTQRVHPGWGCIGGGQARGEGVRVPWACAVTGRALWHACLPSAQTQIRSCPHTALRTMALSVLGNLAAALPSQPRAANKWRRQRVPYRGVAAVQRAPKRRCSGWAERCSDCRLCVDGQALGAFPSSFGTFNRTLL